MSKRAWKLPRCQALRNITAQDIAVDCVNMLYDMISRKVCQLPGREYDLKCCPRDT